MKKNLLAGLIIIFLSINAGCSSLFKKAPEPFKPEFEGTIYQGENFSIFVVKDWQTIETFAPEIPKETVVAFRAPEKINDVRPNVAVIKTALPEEISSPEFIEQNLEKYKKSLIDFKEIDQKEIELVKNNESEESILVYFSGKQNQDSPLFRFMQTAFVFEQEAYVITATMPDKTTEDMVKITSGMLKSFVINEKK